MMIIKKNFFYLVILASMGFCICVKNNNNETISRRCVEYGETCDIKDRLTCCNPNFICKLAVADNYFLCAREAQLGEYCEFDEDCGTVWHARCSSNYKCVCISNHIQKNKNKCVPLLGEYCLKNGECGTENSFCLNNQCQCEDNFYVYSKTQCLPKIINEKCQEDTDCRKIKFTKCSKIKVCVCVMNTVALSPGLCYPLLNVACQMDKDCKVDHSICIKNLCKCKPKYFSLTIGNCTLAYLGMPCENDVDCRIFINNTKCSQGKVCTCDNYYYQTKNGFCKPKHERSCLDDELCNDENSICVNDKCQCKPQFEVKGSKCIVIGTNTCNTDADCDQMWFSVCSSEGKCICRDKYVEINRGTCVLQLNEICQINRQCRIPHSVCENGHCECEPKFLNIANKQCVLIESTVRSCYNHHHICRLFTNSEYLKNGQLVCKEYRVDINATACVAWSGKFCTNSDQCGSKYSVCVNKGCQCKLKYVSHSDIGCPTPFIGMPCLYDSYCKKFIKNSQCLNKICICGADYSKINGKCLPKLHISCLDKGPCAPKNSLCINEKCRCNIQYIQQGEECVLQSLNHFNDSSFLEDSEDTRNTTLQVRSCELDQDCWSSRCSSNKICICKEKSFASNADYCHPVLDGFCRYDEQCGLNFDCVSFKCKCKPSFSPISVNQCVATHQLYSCNGIIDCSDRWHSMCSKNKCVCNTNNIAINNSTCLPILDGYCWRDDQCQTVNSNCIDYRCQCKSTHVAVANNLCVLKN